MKFLRIVLVTAVAGTAAWAVVMPPLSEAPECAMKERKGTRAGKISFGLIESERAKGRWCGANELARLFMEKPF